MNFVKIFTYLLIFYYNFAQTFPEKCWQKAHKGDTEAMLCLHEYYLVTRQDPDSARFWILKAAQKKNPTALYFVGLGYFKGFEGFTKNIQQGLEFLKESADSGNTLALLRLMEIYGDTNASPFIAPEYRRLRNPKKAFFFALKAAEKGAPSAIFYVAKAYFSGRGTPKNDSLAVQWMTLLAEKYQHPQAQLELAQWFYLGTTQFGRDFTKAYRYYQMLAKNPKASLEQAAEGRIGTFQIRQLPQWLHHIKIEAFQQIFPKELFWEVQW